MKQEKLKKNLNELFSKPTLAGSILLKAILFGGDRFTCVDDFVTIEVENKIIGIATIASEGEQSSGTPTIVGVYVMPDFRKRGLGLEITKKALKKCLEKGFKKVRIDAISTAMLKVANQVQIDGLELEVNDLVMPFNDSIFLYN